MPFDRLNYGKDWRNKNDFPTYQDSEQQVREDRQYHPDAVRTFINNLLTKLESAEAAGLIGVAKKEELTKEEGKLSAMLADLYDEIGGVADDLKKLAAGGAPQAVRTAVIGFDTGAWKAASGGHTLTISQENHGRNSHAFGYQLWAETDGVLRSDVWYVAGTCVEYLPTDGSIVLTAEEPYAGRIAFFGV